MVLHVIFEMLIFFSMLLPLEIANASAFLYTTVIYQNPAVYDSKLRHLDLKTAIVTPPKPHTYECQTA